MDSFRILIFNDYSEYIDDSIISECKIHRSCFSDGSNYIEFEPDIILIAISEKDDLSILEYFRSRIEYNNIPIHCILGEKMEKFRLETLRYGADNYSIHPVNAKELKIRLLSTIDRYKSINKVCVLKYLPNLYSDSSNPKLTSREKDILRLVAKGLSNVEISKNLYLSELTVKTHLKNIFSKLNVSNRTEAILVGKTFDLIGKN